MTRVRARGVVLLVAMVAAATVAPRAQPRGDAPQTPDPADLARQVQAHYDTVRDFAADFTQKITGGFLRGAAADGGKLLVKKPGKMRLTYTGRTPREIIADGSQFYDYTPVDKVVFVSPMPAAEDGSTAFLFLAGRGSLARDFTPSMPADQPAGEWHLTLTPKRPQADFTALTLIVERQSLRLAGLIKKDDQGETSTFRFLNLRENTGIADKAFEFTPPPGVKIRR